MKLESVVLVFAVACGSQEPASHTTSLDVAAADTAARASADSVCWPNATSTACVYTPLTPLPEGVPVPNPILLGTDPVAFSAAAAPPGVQRLADGIALGEGALPISSCSSESPFQTRCRTTAAYGAATLDLTGVGLVEDVSVPDVNGASVTLPALVAEMAADFAFGTFASFDGSNYVFANGSISVDANGNVTTATASETTLPSVIATRAFAEDMGAFVGERGNAYEFVRGSVVDNGDGTVSAEASMTALPQTVLDAALVLNLGDVQSADDQDDQRVYHFADGDVFEWHGTVTKAFVQKTLIPGIVVATVIENISGAFSHYFNGGTNEYQFSNLVLVNNDGNTLFTVGEGLLLSN